MTKPNPCKNHCACVVPLLRRVNELELSHEKLLWSIRRMMSHARAIDPATGCRLVIACGKIAVGGTMKGASDAEG